jgi:hypothetical protein
MVPAACTHEPCVGVAETNDVPTGTASVTTVAVAPDGPAFPTASVYVRSFPATTGSTESDFVIERSARGCTVVPSVSLLLPLTGSDTSEETDAVFEMEPPVPAVTTMSTLALPDAESEPSEQVTVPAACRHEPCDGVAET